MSKYGIEHFHIELLEETDQPEERERYWIETKGSFKNGYNATLGGDGKKYIDYDLVVATYNEIKSIKDTAKILQIHPDSVSNILHQKGVKILTTQAVLTNKYGKITNMYDLEDNFIQSFASTNEAARYMVENKLTGCKHTTIKQHITEVCTGRRKTAAKFKWKYSE
jgi:hypothetical protein